MSKRMLAPGYDYAGAALTSVADPTNPQDAATKHYVDTRATAYQQATPTDLGFLDWNFDPLYMNTNGIGPKAGVVNLMKIRAVNGGPVSYIWVAQQNSGGLTSGQNFFGLYDGTGTLIASTADLTAQLGTPAMQKCALTAPVTLTRGQFYWAAVLVNFSGIGSNCNLFGAPAATLVTAANAGLTGYQQRFTTYGTAQTALPSSITTANVTTTGASSWWVGLS